MDLFSLMMMREFVIGPRKRWYHAKRMGFAALCGAMVLFVFFVTGRDSQGTAGRMLFVGLAYLSVIAACLLGPYIAAAALISEKEGRTLDLLYMSDLSALQLIVSKFFSTCLGASLAVISVIPMFLLTVSLGGVQEAQILWALGVLLTAMILGTALGLFVGVMIDSEAQTQRALIVGVFVVFGLVPLVAAVIALAIVKITPGTAVPAGDVVAAVSPFFMVARLKEFEESASTLALYNCIFNLLLSIPIILLTIVLLPRRLVANPNSPIERLKRMFVGRERIGADSKGTVLRKAHRPRLRGNPVQWKDVHILYGGEESIWLRSLIGCVILSIVAGGVYVGISLLAKGSFDSGVAIFTVSATALTISSVSFIIGSVTRSIRTLGREMHGRTLELLLSSDLTVTDIVDGKAHAILVSVMPWMVSIAVTTVTTAIFGRLFMDFPGELIMIMLALPLNAIGMVYAYNHIAMRLSLRMEHQSTAVGISGFVVWYVVGNVVISVVAGVLFFFTAGLSLVLVPFLGPIIIGYQMRLTLLRQLRRMAVARAFL